MKINDLMKYSGKPPLYEAGTAFMWTDNHISKQLLAVHLNDEVDLASRKATTIDSTIKWILGKAPRRPLEILDMGCGPGLYTQRLAQMGHRVQGMDISENAIAYAQQHAAGEGLDITYHLQDYASMPHDAAFDLVILIYTDLGVLLPGVRKTVMENVYRALRPGGIFIFDVLNVHRRQEKLTPRNWEVSPGGFWRNHPYVALSESFFYPEDDVILYQHIIGDDNGVAVYRFWTHLFSDETIGLLTGHAGFLSWECHSDVLPANDAFSGDNVTFCVAKK